MKIIFIFPEIPIKKYNNGQANKQENWWNHDKKYQIPEEEKILQTTMIHVSN